MLQQYRRHTKKCVKGYEQHDRKRNDCRCIIYVEGKLNKYGEYIKESAGTRNWQNVRKMIVAAEEQGTWPPSLSDVSITEPSPKDDSSVSVAHAVDTFLAEVCSEKGRNVAKATGGKYRTLLGRLKTFCSERGFVAIAELTVHHLLRFKATWTTGPRATRNNIQRLRSFFRFCLNLKWINESPAQSLEMPKNIKPTQKMPFTASEMERIIQTALTIKLHSQQTINNHDLYAFVLAMRYTGLRISDVGLLTADRFKGDHIHLYAQKNGAPVYCPLPPWVANVLKSVELKQEQYLFCTGSTRLETVVELWGKRLRHVFKEAKIAGGTSHRFRHTFAVDLLVNGADVKNVSELVP